MRGRGHVAIDVAARPRLEQLELRREVFDLLAGDARDALLALQTGSVMALHAILLLRDAGRDGERLGARLTHGLPWLQPAVIGGEIAEILVGERRGELRHRLRRPMAVAELEQREHDIVVPLPGERGDDRLLGNAAFAVTRRAHLLGLLPPGLGIISQGRGGECQRAESGKKKRR